jgi:hypothetical protein
LQQLRTVFILLSLLFGKDIFLRFTTLVKFLAYALHGMKLIIELTEEKEEGKKTKPLNLKSFVYTFHANILPDVFLSLNLL